MPKNSNTKKDSPQQVMLEKCEAQVSNMQEAAMSGLREAGNPKAGCRCSATQQIASLREQDSALHVKDYPKRVNQIYLVGARGKMGRAILNLASSQITSSIKEADVIIDFSSSEGTQAALEAALRHEIPLVTGTTGLPKEIEKKIKSASAFIPVLSSPNFSFGIALFLKILPQIVKNIKQDYRCKIVETHHCHKKDSPSGTALKLARAIDQKVSIESVREGEVIGEHKIFFNLDEETLELRHEALSRDAFAKGALMAANFLVNKPPGLYTLMDLVE